MHNYYANYWGHCDKQHRAPTYMWERQTSDQRLQWSKFIIMVSWEPVGGTPIKIQKEINGLFWQGE